MKTRRASSIEDVLRPLAAENAANRGGSWGGLLAQNCEARVIAGTFVVKNRSLKNFCSADSGGKFDATYSCACQRFSESLDRLFDARHRPSVRQGAVREP